MSSWTNSEWLRLAASNATVVNHARIIPNDRKERKLLARPEGFEPPTLCFEGRYSIQLSYGREVLILLDWHPRVECSNSPARS